MGKTKISWTEFTVNPIQAIDPENDAQGHWCEKISPGCQFCYASALQTRFKMHPYVASNADKVQLQLSDTVLDSVVKRKKPTMYFWGSMTDMFLERHEYEWIDKCFAAMYASPQHVHMVLTKRPDQAIAYFERPHVRNAVAKWAFHQDQRLHPDDLGMRTQQDMVKYLHAPGRWPLEHVIMGVSVENNDYLWRIERLLHIPAAKRFVSCEPLLDEVDLSAFLGISRADDGSWQKATQPPVIDWVISGGESGKDHSGGRLALVDHFRLLRDQCAAAEVPFHHKQNGEWAQVSDIAHLQDLDESKYHVKSVNGVAYWRVGKNRAGRLLDGQEHLEMPKDL